MTPRTASRPSPALGVRPLGSPDDVVVGIVLSAHLSTRGTITVTEVGVLRGDVVADEVVVAGRVEGTVLAQRVTLHPNARVEGNLCCIDLTWWDGAEVTGDCAAHHVSSGQAAGVTVSDGSVRPDVDVRDRPLPPPRSARTLPDGTRTGRKPPPPKKKKKGERSSQRAPSNPRIAWGATLLCGVVAATLTVGVTALLNRSEPEADQLLDLTPVLVVPAARVPSPPPVPTTRRAPEATPRRLARPAPTMSEPAPPLVIPSRLPPFFPRRAPGF